MIAALPHGTEGHGDAHLVPDRHDARPAGVRTPSGAAGRIPGHPGSTGSPGFGMLDEMGPSRNEILSAAALVGVLVLLMLVLVVWAVPPGGAPALQ